MRTLRLAFALAAALCAVAVAPTAAGAAFSVSGWHMTPSTLQAGAHPTANMGITASVADNDKASDDIKSVRVDFPAGALVNAQATAPCTTTAFSGDACPASSQIGTISALVYKGKTAISAPGSVYLLTPSAGNPMEFGFVLRPSGYRRVVLRTSNVAGLVAVRTGPDADYGLTATIDQIPNTLTTTRGQVVAITIANVTVSLFGRTGAAQSGPYFTFNPTRCSPAVSRATVTSYLGATVTMSSSFTPTGCEQVRLDAAATVVPTVVEAGAASGISATVSVPQADQPIQQSHVALVGLDLPRGATLNSSALSGKTLCTDAQLGANSCPTSSRIGSAAVDVPFLASPMTGDIFLTTSEQGKLSFAFTIRSGAVVATMRGASTLIDGDGDGSLETIRTVIENLPQAPWRSATLNFETQLVVNPTTCPGSSTLVAWGYANSFSILNPPYPCQQLPPLDIAIAAPADGSVIQGNSFNLQYAVTGGKAPYTYECSLYDVSLGRLLSPAPCTQGQLYSNLTPGNSFRMIASVRDSAGNVDTATSNFSTAPGAPVAPEILSGANGAAYTDRTPEFRWEQLDVVAHAGATFDCALVPAGVTPTSYESCGPTSWTPATDLTDGNYVFHVREHSGAQVSPAAQQSFTVANWSPAYNASVSTTQAGAHPRQTVTTSYPAGQPRRLDMLMPSGLIGSENSFPRCSLTAAAASACPAETRIGTANVVVDLFLIPNFPIEGEVYMTEVIQPGDLVGMSVRIPGLKPALDDVIIPLRVIGVNNASQMRVFSDSIPTQVRQFYPYAGMRDFYVNQFNMTLNGDLGSPYPLLTNPTSCAAKVFATTFGDLAGNSATPPNVPFQATGCTSLAFSPTLAQTFSGNAAGAEVDVTTTITAAPGQANIQRIRVVEPPSLGINTASLGSSADQCAPAFTGPDGQLTFDPATCPPQSRIGTATIVTPLIPAPLTGNVYLSVSSPLPRLAMHIKDDAAGVEIKLLGTVSTITAPQCSDGSCNISQLQVVFNNSPDVPTSSITMSLGGIDRGGSLSSHPLVVAAASDESCLADSTGSWALFPWTGGAASSGVLPYSVSGCPQP